MERENTQNKNTTCRKSTNSHEIPLRKKWKMETNKNNEKLMIDTE